MNIIIKKILFFSFICTLVLNKGFANDSPSLAEEKDYVERSFGDVLRDLLNDFSYDLKTGKIPQSWTISIRSVSVNDSIPLSYRTYIQTLVLDRLQRFSKFQVIECPECHVKQTVVKDGQVKTFLPINDSGELDALASKFGIQAWMDVALIYEETSMILAVNIYDASSRQLLIAKAYSSANVSYKKDAELVNELGDEAEKLSVSELFMGLSVGYEIVPNVRETSRMLSATVRFSEKFNLERSEIGSSFSFIFRPQSLNPKYPSAGDPSIVGAKKVDQSPKDIVLQPFNYGLIVQANYYHHFISYPQNVQTIRYGVHFDAGIVVSMGFLSYIMSVGPLINLGAGWFLEGAVSYSTPATLNLQNDFTYTTAGGFGGNIRFGFQF